MLQLSAIEQNTFELLKKLQKFSLKDILNFYSSKYSDGSIFAAMKSLTYFDDAENDIFTPFFFFVFYVL